MMVKIVHNKLLGGWYVVRGPHQTPLSGRFDSKAEAEASLKSKALARDARMREVGKAIERAYPWGYRSENNEP